MDIAIVTGAASSLGLAISRRLIDLGFRVYGLGGDYKDCPLNNINFRPQSLDLADPVAIERACTAILAKEKGVCLLVNNAKYFGRRPFREMDFAEMESILRINLLAPLVLIRTLQPSLCALQGMIIQIGSAAATTSYAGAVGAAASGGLKWMGEALFHDLRESGVRVCHLSPEPNRQRDAAPAPTSQRKESVIDPEAVAQAIEQLVQTPYGNIVTELVLRPLRLREREEPSVVRVPAPKPQPIPYTVPRAVIEAEEQLEEQERLEREEARFQQRQQRRERIAAEKAEKAGEQESPVASADTPSPPVPASEEAPAAAREAASTASSAPVGNGVNQSASAARKSRRKPKPPMSTVGFLDRVKPVETARPAAGPVAATDPAPAPEAEPTTRKKPAAKKGGARKAAAKKSPAKKAAAKKAAAKKSGRKAAKGEA